MFLLLTPVAVFQHFVHVPTVKLEIMRKNNYNNKHEQSSEIHKTSQNTHRDEVMGNGIQ